MRKRNICRGGFSPPSAPAVVGAQHRFTQTSKSCALCTRTYTKALTSGSPMFRRFDVSTFRIFDFLTLELLNS